ncbi:helix-turn-helix domain-containing protein [Methylobacterium planeticum]|uniref:histidine kinase n=1 Tax=Methylobacterium planeticum TaxID=2615211 RepID=A0A6N6MTD6_9HYPH|nr:helix-turn-helix transcriptional regulator [Methylobacterium planeticum]KAB1075148.1 PAS domain-containing protein [Methylobacterium planeticum]
MTLLLTPSALPYSSRALLRLIEGAGLTGNWGWNFATNEHVWSPGLFRLLGLEPGMVPPSYDLFLHLVHPEDRASLETGAQMRDGLARNATVRVIRPDGTMRLLSIQTEIYVAPDGRPQAAAGTVLDITDREALARAQAAERRRAWALFQRTRSFTHTYSHPALEFSREFMDLTGQSREAFLEDSQRAIASEERSFWREFGAEHFPSARIFHATPLLILADGQKGRFRFIVLPILRPDGGIEGWTHFVTPVGRQGLQPTGDVRRRLEEQVRGHHVRAARALLGWSMHDLAAASGLSFSTIRRLEDDVEAIAARSRHAAVAALRTAGICFSLLDGAAIAVARA